MMLGCVVERMLWKKLRAIGHSPTLKAELDSNDWLQIVHLDLDLSKSIYIYIYILTYYV